MTNRRQRPNDQKTMLVSGGAGFLGGHLVRQALSRPDIDRLVVVDNLWTGSADTLAGFRDDRLHFEQCDVATFSTSERFDEIIHMASPASPPCYMLDPLGTITANVQGAINLLGKLAPGGTFSFTSTSEVYGDPAVSPQSESYRGAVDCTGPRSSYDEAKRCTEALLFELHRTAGIDIRVARIFNSYGPGIQVDDGRMISNFLVQSLTTGELTVHGDGTQSRSWGYVDDIVEGMVRFFWRDDHGHIGPVNIGNDTEIAVIDVARLVQRLMPGTTMRFCAPFPQDPSNRRPDLALARRILPGWSADTDLETGLARTLDWFRGRLTEPRADD